jgi:thiol-disulfide isomerase/thioredoxin
VTGRSRIEVVLGTWCSDSLREVPRLQRIVDDVDSDAIELDLVGVDRTKRIWVDGLSAELAAGTEVERVPTIVVLDEGGVELGRVVETAERPLEELLVEVLSAAGATP